MPEIVLEKIEEPVMEEAVPETAAPPEPVEQAPEEVTLDPTLEEEEIPDPPVLQRQLTQVPEPAPKKRGRPPKAKAEAPPKPPKPAPKPKATRAKKPAPPESDSSSEDMDETLRNVYNHVAKPDMETAILQFLVNRKQSEQARRRELWGRLAQM
jgi:hypothetical protein